jgi:osmotically-inducible protein OsmY
MEEQVSSGTYYSDIDIHEEVVTAIDKLAFVRESRPQVKLSVEDGVVTAEGVVISEVIRQGVLWAAATVPGVKDVVDRLQTDSGLQMAVARALADNPALAERRIFVTAYQGVITLAGQVASEEERKAASGAASEIDGVRSVAANLTVSA